MKRVLLLDILNAPERAAGLTLAEWDLLIRQGRRANLLSTLAFRLSTDIDSIPQAPRHHLEAALKVARRQGQTTHWEVRCIREALAPLGVEPILLKGAAYLMADLPASEGRLFGDVDILVPKASIADVEAAFIAHGWSFKPDLDAYGQRYYREWMHELPPLGHEERGASLDVHHTILPPTARVQVNTEALFDDTRALPDMPGVRVFGPVTMFLHSAAHLFHEGELDKGLRDLFDLDALLRDFGRQPGFWPALVPRAEELGLTMPLFHALHYTSLLVATPVPRPVLDRVRAYRPAAQPLLDACYQRALMPAHASCDDRFTALARGAVYVRSHWLRMPMGLLARHLARKAWLRMQPETEAQA